MNGLAAGGRQLVGSGERTSAALVRLESWRLVRPAGQRKNLEGILMGLLPREGTVLVSTCAAVVSATTLAYAATTTPPGA